MDLIIPAFLRKSDGEVLVDLIISVLWGEGDLRERIIPLFRIKCALFVSSPVGRTTMSIFSCLG